MSADGAPFFGTQSAPVVFRHLLRLKSEVDVTCLTLVPAPADYPFKHIEVSPRYPGHLPERPWLPFSKRINRHQKAKHLVRKLGLHPGDRIISNLHEREHALARDLSRLSGAPLVCILHDLWPATEDNDAPRTLAHASAVLAVSENLAALARKFTSGQVELMPPLGEEPLPWSELPSQTMRIGIAGSLSPAYVTVATRLGLPVLALGWNGARPPGVETHPFFPQNRDALRLLQQECRALLVYQTPKDGDYARYSFPSRFVDFVQTGLPVILVAAPETNLGRWAQNQAWPLWVRDEHSAAAFAEVAQKLADPNAWREASLRTQALAMGEFNADRIHRVFLSALELKPQPDPAT